VFNLSLNLTYSDKLEKIAKYYPEQVTNNLRAYTKEEISKLLSLADIRLLSYFGDDICWNAG
jgi:hypothetical protein